MARQEDERFEGGVYRTSHSHIVTQAVAAVRLRYNRLRIQQEVVLGANATRGRVSEAAEPGKAVVALGRAPAARVRASGAS